MRAHKPNAKMTVEIVRMVRQSKHSSYHLGRLLNLNSRTIRLCRRRITWSDVK